MKKYLIRERIKEYKSLLTEERIKEDSNFIIDRLLQSDWYKKSNIIITYVHFNQEVRTKDFIKHALMDGKRVAVPKIINNEMEFIWIHADSMYDASTLGIDEPTNELIVQKEELMKESMILNIVPGLAFDYKKNRVGYGKGFYDRYFDKYSEVKFYKLAITYDFQIVDEIDASPYDIKVDEIISRNYHIV